MNRHETEKKRLALIVPIEREARALGKRVRRDYLVLTPRLEGRVDLLVADGSRETMYGALNSLDLVHWKLMIARAKKADELRLIFPNSRLVRAAKQRVDELRASGKAGSVSVLCLTVEAAVELLRNGNGTDDFSASVDQQPSQKPSDRTTTPATKGQSPCKCD